MKRILFTALFSTALLLSGTVFAMDLSQARAQGLVGEKADGYIAAVTPTAEANAVVSDVNARRKAEYERISKENGQPVSIVGKVASETIIKGLPSGSYYQSASGAWQKK